MFFAFAFWERSRRVPSSGLRGRDVPQDLFFPFITLTTTGYGNLVPAGNPGQSFAVLEMLIGQLFLVKAEAKAVTPGGRNLVGTPRATCPMTDDRVPT